MSDTAGNITTYRLAGYAALIEDYNLDVIPNRHRSLVTASGIHRVESRAGVVIEIYPPRYWPGDKTGHHLEFAFKYDATNLAILATLFQNIPEEDILDYVRSKPTGKYARRVWYLYEFLTGKKLPLSDLKRGNYINLLEADEYYTVAPARQVRRQRINDNLLGNRRFCPMVRRSYTLWEFERNDLSGR